MRRLSRPDRTSFSICSILALFHHPRSHPVERLSHNFRILGVPQLRVVGRFSVPSSAERRYSRAGIFPWGGQAQVGPDGEKVVSARAIKHVAELTAIASGRKKDTQGPLGAGLVFVVVRGDCHSFRPNADACPSFHAHCTRARNAGVQVIAHKVSWRINGGRADAVHDGKIEVQL